MAAVLVVDDDASIRRMLRIALEYSGHTVVEARDGRTALDYLCVADVPHVILLDQWMPLVSGESLLARLADSPESAAHHTCVLMTAQAEFLSPQCRRLLAEMAVPIMSKPFDLNDLLDLVDELAEGLVHGIRAKGLPAAG